ncbi:MAG: acetyl-CoA synthetase [Solirubrobacteraceae bacterium]|nr:acetyl-CoA synthetase [Solirubrobacteraceae bacterium]
MTTTTGTSDDPGRASSFDPPADFVSRSLITDLSVHASAAADPVAWWGEQARELLEWERDFTETLDESRAPFHRWFADGAINASVNCLDRHVAAGRGDRVAYHWVGETGEARDVTYADLHRDVQRFANALRSAGVLEGDVVGVYLPMIPEVVVAMLACARIGAIHNVVFGGFSAQSVRERMASSHARALVTVDGARRKGRTTPVKAALDAAGIDVETTFVVRHTGTDCPMGDGDVYFDAAMAAAEAVCEPAPLDAEHPLFLLYSSGSTAAPKGIVHSTGGYLTQVAWTHRHVFDLDPGADVWFCTADVGWITGHSYVVYGPLLNGATSVMYEGAPDHPHKGIWWELCERFGVTTFYTAPTAIRACMKWGADLVSRHDLSSLRLLGSVGEPIHPETWLWYRDVVGGGRCPIVDTWWQTETGAIMVTTLPGAQAAKPGSAGTPLPGIDVRVTDEGILTVGRPWPAMLRTLFEDAPRYAETYFGRFGPGTYVAGDAARRDDDGYLWLLGRIDDVINVSGHRLSTAEVEAALNTHPAVADAAVIAQDDADTGQAIVAFVNPAGDVAGDPELMGELREHVAGRIGKLARPKRIIWAADLPKTRSGKIMRRLLRDVAEGRELGDVTTLNEPAAIEELQQRIGVAADDVGA